MSATSAKTQNSYLFDNPTPEILEMKPALEQLIVETLNKSYGEKFSELPSYQALRSQDASYQGRLALAVATLMQRCTQEDYRIRYTLGELLGAMLRGTLGLSEAEYLRLFGLYGLDFITAEAPSLHFWPFPVGLTLVQVARLAKKQGQLSEPMVQFLRQLLHHTSGQPGDTGKVALKAQDILNQVTDTEIVPTVVFAADDAFGQALNQLVASLGPTAAALPWLRLLQLWQKAVGAQPTAKYRKEMETAVADGEAAAVREKCKELLAVLASVAVEVRTKTVTYDNGRTYDYTEHAYVQEANLTAAKGLVWTVLLVADDALLQQLADMAVKCYRKIPGRGPLAAGLGNACLLVLAGSGLAGVSYLSRVRPKIKQANTQALIAGHIEKASQVLGVSPAELEDMAVPDFGLTDGQLRQEYGEYAATLRLVDGKAEVQWEKAGKPIKSVPTALKSAHAEDLKALKSSQTQLQQTFTAQRERLDRGFVEARHLPIAWFQQYYEQHGLLSCLTRQLMWRFHHSDSSFTDAFWHDDAWRTATGQPVPTAETDTVQLWHPVLAPTEDVLIWRALLDAKQLRQPLKQAYREVYLLTPPEERTSTYSNRMAAHMLRQHQFNSLAKLRGWRYSLMGAYDKGYESDEATLDLPAHGLQAQFWVSEVNADHAWNDTGIWHYVSTDQVRFVGSTGPVPLPQVPPLVFSEVMRDVDLFVGVASVGNDPLWRDNGGLPAYRNYWENYSFGELGEVAKNRRMALERLVPRLKIGKVSEIRDRFLVVRGKLRTYKIHLGSGNILMEPNDEYLCIVPDRSAKAAGANGVFLPFEGDAVLSIILSKALLLMDDDQITDDTITRQIGRQSPRPAS